MKWRATPRRTTAPIDRLEPVEMINGRRRGAQRNARYGAVDFGPIAALLQLRWSPAEIVGRREGLPVMMSHETIYLWIWRDKTSRGLPVDPSAGRPHAPPQTLWSKDNCGRLEGKRPIRERPAIVERRGRFCDWEMDTVHGKDKPCVVTVVERKSGFVHIGSDSCPRQRPIG